MATNKILAGTDSKNRERALADVSIPATPTSVQSGTAVIVSGRPAVSITASGGATKTQTSGLPAGLTSITYENGGVGNADASATFAFDGTYEFAVTGALTTTKSDVEVFITSAGALTLTAGSNTHFGWTDYPRDYTKTAGRAAVRIGA